MTIVEMQMNIDCNGCEDNVRKALLRLHGVDYVEVDRVRGKVTVTGSASQKKVLRVARRSGRLAVLWPSAYDTGHHHNHQVYYPQPQPAYYHHHHQAAITPAVSAAASRAPHHHYSSVQKMNGGGGGGGKVMSSYNYHVHGYLDSDLHGYNGHHHHHAGVSYFSDDNPHACAVM